MMIVSQPESDIWAQQANGLLHKLDLFIRARVPADSAADVLQEVFLKIHHHADAVRELERFDAWAYQIARNTIADYYRARRADRLTNNIIDPDSIADDLPAPEADEPDELLTCLIDSVRGMIAQLPHHYREALILTEFRGMTQNEFADYAGLSIPGAKSRVQRARKLLREMLLACCDFQLDRRNHVIDYHARGRSCHDSPECSCAC